MAEFAGAGATHLKQKNIVLSKNLRPALLALALGITQFFMTNYFFSSFVNLALSFLIVCRILSAFAFFTFLLERGFPASKVWRHAGLPHQHGYCAINFFVMGSSMIKP